MRLSDWSSDVCSSDLNYGAAKMALVGLMQTLGIEGEKYNVRVNCLAPTAATQMTDGVLAADALAHLAPEAVSPGLRSAERTVGKEGGSPGRSRWSPFP